MTKLLLDYGLVLLFLVVLLESAGLPFLPGELALIGAALLAQPGKHHFSIVAVIAVAASAGVLGYVVGYWLGRLGGRRLVERWEPVARHARNALPPSERFFQRHGSKTVFIGRFVVLLRATAAWMAGITHMRWWPFLAWNIAGAVVWAVGYGLLAYYAGRAVVDAIDRYSVYAVVAIVVLVVVGWLGTRLWRRRFAGSA
ncbi:MAG TPA: DedA family protein [Gaiellaceae bacterium]|nr:DedA family protein [Gaiellaceae bacterium]